MITAVHMQAKFVSYGKFVVSRVVAYFNLNISICFMSVAEVRTFAVHIVHRLNEQKVMPIKLPKIPF
jgi:hypothetical protein